MHIYKRKLSSVSSFHGVRVRNERYCVPEVPSVATVHGTMIDQARAYLHDIQTAIASSFSIT